MARDSADLDTPANIGRKAGERTVRRLGTQRLSTRQSPVIFAAEVARGLFGNFISAIQGGNLYRKASFLLDHLGKPVFPEFLRIHEEPLLRKGIASAPYDSEGVATRARDIVTGGVLQGYVLDSYSACRLGMQTTGIGGTQEDYYMLHEGQKYWSDPWHWVQANIVAACRTHGVLPVDGPFDPNWLLEMRCARSALDGARVLTPGGLRHSDEAVSAAIKAGKVSCWTCKP